MSHSTAAFVQTGALHSPPRPLLRLLNRLNDGSSVGSYTGPQVGALLGDTIDGSAVGRGRSSWMNSGWKRHSRSVDGTSLHLTLGVNDDTGVVLEVKEHAVPSPPGLALTADDGGHDWGCQSGLVRPPDYHDLISSHSARALPSNPPIHPSTSKTSTHPSSSTRAFPS
jgi:hypothetical protein